MNPHVETARAHAKAWAKAVGLLDKQPSTRGVRAWDEAEYDALDFGLFAALTFPDASALKLDLLTDWNVWSWYTFNFFLDALREMGPAGAKDYVRHLSAFTPMKGVSSPPPTNPVEAGLADLWTRTVATSSAEWRARLYDVCQRNLQTVLWSVFNTWVVDPIDYFTGAMRTSVGMELVSCLLEVGLGIEIPTELAATRPLRVAREAFGDGVALRNDIFIFHGGHASKSTHATSAPNGVSVIQRFLGCEPQRAVDVVNELATSRTQQFEHTSLTELPALFEDEGLGLKERADLFRFVKGLQDWSAGSYQWSTRSSGPTDGASAPEPTKSPEHDRAPHLHGPTGLGTAAARLGVTRRLASIAMPGRSSEEEREAAAKIPLPKIYMPFQSRCNPQMQAARADAKAWARQMGLLDTGLSGWDERGFDAADYPGQSGWFFPDAPRAKLEVAARWSVWGWFVGTLFEEAFTRPRDLAGARAFVLRLSEFMPVSAPELGPTPTTPVERALADLWPRTAAAMSIDWRQRFAQHFLDVAEAQIWKISNLIQHRVPDPIDYIEMRQHSTAGWTSVLLVEYVHGFEVPPDLFRALPIKGMHDAVINWQTVLNDLYSYQKERDGEGDLHNGVLIMQRFLECELQESVRLNNDLLTSQLRHFEHLATTKVAPLFRDLAVSAEVEEGVREYVLGLRHCFAGYLQLYRHLRTSRYAPDAGLESSTTSSPSVMRSLLGPTGTGTAAARIGLAPDTRDSAPPKKPFELPEFYVPYEARLNPHLDEARERGKQWAYAMGILGAPAGSPGADVWSERKFVAMDFPLLTAYTHPDASADELALITEWYVWVFYLDDHFLETYKRSRDLSGALVYLNGLLAFMPMNLGDAVPEPRNPVEAGLWDLWPRTVSTMSLAWRTRFWDSNYLLIRSFLWELTNLDQNSVPNPVDYIGMRRRTGGALWSADLVEHALGVEVPAAVVASRAMRVLKDTFTDGVHLLNDIFSYQREIEEEGEISNGVLVMQRFMGSTPQQAADLVNDLHTSRLQQFENTLLTEVPLLQEDHDLDAKAWSDILSYVKGLQDWLGGNHAWHYRSPRYMNAGVTQPQTAGTRAPANLAELGTMAARLGIPVRLRSLGARAKTVMTSAGRKNERLPLPKLFMPYRARYNPHLEAARIATKAWAIEMGYVGSGLSGWDEASFDSTDLTLFAAMIFPDAPRERFETLAKWQVWGFYYEDYLDEKFKKTRDRAGAKEFQERILPFMPVANPDVVKRSLQLFVRARPNPGDGARQGAVADDRPNHGVPIPTNEIERGLADLWPRTVVAMSEDWSYQFRWAIEYFFPGFLWEIHNLDQDRVPDPVDYIEMRRRTADIVFPIALMQYGLGRELHTHMLGSLPMLRLIDTCIDWEGLINDIFSYQKEIDSEGEIHNAVIVIQRFLDTDLRRAASIASDLATSQLLTFEETIATDLPALAVELELDAAARENLDRCVEGLRDLIAGFFYFHSLSGRYAATFAPHTDRDEEAPPAAQSSALARRLRGPTGLGTSAFRIGARS
ncbi:MAG: hypothetical protein IPK80_34725 [Nannocystis sp.]|nr:hypothetical protein [Nannocystis sp.]